MGTEYILGEKLHEQHGDAAGKMLVLDPSSQPGTLLEDFLEIGS